MADESYKRKLTAILSADVEGYSLLMRDDEEATIRTLTTYRKAVTKLIHQYRGRLIDATGDNFLSEFTSVVDAVNCAVEIQRELAERNAELSENRRMQFRIGINLGDVVEEEGRIYGDGVNVAARMEGLAEGGGICISGKVYEEVKNKLGLEYEYLGEQEVKNITEPVRAYRVLSYPGAAAHRVVKAKKAVGKTWRNILVAVAAILVIGAAVAIWSFYLRPTSSVEVASVEKMAYPLPDKPSIAVLPFDNMSGDPNQEYLSDGITEEIISALSKLEKLFVTARNSTFTYKGKAVKVQQVSEDLGVRYVLEGSLKKYENRVRVTAQLIDALNGRHLWSERYDRELKDIFSLQDEITQQIISALQVKLTEGEQAAIHARGTKILDAYLKVLQARDLARHQNIEDNHQARRILQEALELAPDYAPLYRWLSTTHYMDVFLGSTESPRDSLNHAAELSKRALSIDNSLGDAHALLGSIYVLTRQYEKGITELRKAVDLDPNGADTRAHLALGLLFMDQSEEGVLVSNQAIRLNPIAPSWYLHNLAAMYRNMNNYEEGLPWAEKAVNQEPKNILSRLVLCSIYSLLGRMEDAQREANQVMKLNPKFSLDRFEKTLPYTNLETKKRYIDALHKAGLN